MRSLCAVLCCHLWPVRLYHIFPHYFIKGTIFWKIFIEHKICVLASFLRILSEIFLITRRIQRDIIINVRKPSHKVRVTAGRFKRNLNFLHEFSKNLQISNFVNLIFVVPCIMRYSGEISPTRCNNCVFYSQWLYSTCFG
jgi:hypothetical protein